MTSLQPVAQPAVQLKMPYIPVVIKAVPSTDEQLLQDSEQPVPAAQPQAGSFIL